MIMKLIKNKLPFLIYSFVFGLAIVISATSCQKDEVVVPKTLEEYKTELSSLVTSEKTKVENCVVGYDKGNFKGETNFQDYKYNYMLELVAAEEVLAKPDLTIADIVAANKALTSPGNDFNSSLFISDRRPLQEEIVYCDTLRVHTPEGTETGQAPAAARNTFIAAISDAKSVRDRSTTIDRQVSEAVDALKQSLVDFQNSIIK
jgi:hypothetical protein